MRRHFYLFAAVLVALSALTFGGCSSSQVTAPSGQEFTLAVGQKAVISGENIAIEFIGVTADSRCPQGVTCIWAGEVSCTLKITLAGKEPFNLGITQPGGSATATQEFDDHVLTFNVTPYPVQGKKIASGDYRLTMTVARATPVTLSAPELKFKLLADYPDYFWCDPDIYPIAREGQEQANAIAQFPAIQSNTELFNAVLAHLGLEQKSQYTDEEKLLIYRQYKLLNYAVQLTQSGGGYTYSIRVGKGQGQTIEGTITTSGVIKVTKTVPSINTCPICLAKGTQIDTPDGPVAVEDLTVGLPVWTFDLSGRRYAATVEKTASTPTPESFILVKVTLSDGRTVTAAPGHPDADGRPLGQFKPGDNLDGASVVAVESVVYSGATYDILPSGNTGLYRAGGILLMSTLRNVY